MPTPARTFASRSALAATLALLGAASISTAQNVIIVAPSGGPGVESIELWKAVLEAPSGSTLLLRSGSYGGFFMQSSKSLHLVADVGAQVTLVSPSIVFNLAAEHVLTMRGIDFAVANANALWVTGCKGAVWVEDADIDASAGNAATAVNVYNSPAVTLVGVDVVGPIGGAALTARAEPGATTNVHLFDCTLRGGDGHFVEVGLHGGDGARVDGARIFASGSELRGGDGHTYEHPTMGCLTGRGGNGLSFLASTNANDIALLASSMHGGFGANQCGWAPIDGVAHTGPGSITTLAGTPRALAVNSPVREGESAVLQFSGASGELAVLALGKPSVGFGAATWESLLAPVLVGAPLSTFVAGFVPQGGVLAQSIPIQDLGLGIEGYALHAQPAFVSIGTATAQLGAPTQLVILEQTL